MAKTREKLALVLHDSNNHDVYLVQARENAKRVPCLVVAQTHPAGHLGAARRATRWHQYERVVSSWGSQVNVLGYIVGTKVVVTKG